jgi:hypothetical protein
MIFVGGAVNLGLPSFLNANGQPPTPVKTPPGYSTYLGGKGVEDGHALDVDSSGNVYIVGDSSSVDYPTTPQALQKSTKGARASFITKLNAAGELIYSTYLNGGGAKCIAVDANGNMYVAGSAYPQDFQTTQGAFQPVSKVGGAFIAKLNAAGDKLIYSTYLGGSSGADWINDIAVDAAGNAYVTGSTSSRDFPVTAGAFRQTYHGGGQYSPEGFVTKINSAGSALIYSTYLGGGGRDELRSIALDEAGNAYLTGSTDSSDFPTTSGAVQSRYGAGSEVFVTKLNAQGNKILYSTYIGGSGSDVGQAIAVDHSGSAYITGHTFSKDFPRTRGAFQSELKSQDNHAFVTKLNEQGSALAYSTLLGRETSGYGIAVDKVGAAYVTGSTRSGKFPTTADAFQRKFEGGFKRFNFEDLFYNEGFPPDAFISVLTPPGDQLVYSTYVGAWDDEVGRDIKVDGTGSICVTGQTESSKFPASRGALQTKNGGYADAFVIKIIR